MHENRCLSENLPLGQSLAPEGAPGSSRLGVGLGKKLLYNEFSVRSIEGGRRSAFGHSEEKTARTIWGSSGSPG